MTSRASLASRLLCAGALAAVVSQLALAQGPPSTTVPQTGSITGRVTSPAPVRYARVRIVPEGTLERIAGTGTVRQSTSRPLVGKVSTDGDGRYLFDNVPVGRYRVLVDKPGFTSLASVEGEAVDVRPSARSTLDLHLERGAAIEGTLFDSNGTLVPRTTPVIFADPVATEVAASSAKGASTWTNDAGQFRLSSLPRGRYVVRVDVGSGQPTAWYYPGTARRELAQVVTLTPGQTFTIGDFALPSDGDVARAADVADRLGIADARGTGVVEGRVLDNFGDSAPWITVRLLERRFIAGRFRLAGRSNLGRVADPDMNRVTDDLGRFRFSRLLPGDYYLVALPEPFSTVGYAPSNEGLSGLLPMFFPHFDQPIDAQPLRLGAGDLVSGLTLSLPATKTGTIVVRLLDENGRVAPEQQLTSVAAMYRTQGGYVHPALSAQVRSQDGLLVFRHVPAGEYAMSLGGNFRVFVAGDDVVNVSVPPFPRGMVSSGRISFEGDASRPSADRVQIAWQLPGEIAPTIGIGPVHADIDSQWNLSWRPFGAPAAVVRLVGAPKGWALKRVGLGDQDVTDTPLALAGGVTGLEILLTSRTGTVAGTVTVDGPPSNARGVIVFAEERERWTYPSRFIHVAHVDTQGQFEIAGILPGKYLALPLPNNTDQGADPEWLDMMRASAVPVVITEGGTIRITLPAPR